MKRLPASPSVALLVALAFGGSVVVAAATALNPRDPAPATATRDVHGFVSIGRPISPYRAGKPPLGQIELRIRDPQGGAPHAVLFHRYAGASLPLQLIFSSQGIGFSDAVNRELVATEIVATRVGSIGLVAAVPLTTATAALLALRLPIALLPEHGHTHHH